MPSNFFLKQFLFAWPAGRPSICHFYYFCNSFLHAPCGNQLQLTGLPWVNKVFLSIYSVSFGDKPAGNIATVALQKTAEMMKDEFPNASQVILNNTYVDDIVDSVENTSSALKVTDQIEMSSKAEDSKSSTGHTAENENNCTPTDLPDCDRECETTMESTGQLISDNEHEQKVLGLQWNPKDDCFHFKVVLNFAPHIRKVRSGPNLSQDQVQH